MRRNAASTLLVETCHVHTLTYRCTRTHARVDMRTRVDACAAKHHAHVATARALSPIAYHRTRTHCCVHRLVPARDCEVASLVTTTDSRRQHHQQHQHRGVRGSSRLGGVMASSAFAPRRSGPSGVRKLTLKNFGEQLTSLSTQIFPSSGRMHG
jgi:hypothetical protein